MSAALLQDIADLRAIIGPSQITCMMELMRGEEGEYYRDLISTYAERFRAMPKVYEQDGLGDDAVVHLHYFHASGSDWWITERDMERAQHQAFGFACLNGDTQNAELGYICITELIQNGVELDLHFEPCPLGDVKEAISV